MPLSRQISGINNEASQKLRVTLENTVYVIELYYQDISESWFLNLRDSNNTPITMGRRLSTNMPVFSHILTGLNGSLAPLSLVTPSVPLTRYSWGITHTLVFSDAPE